MLPYDTPLSRLLNEKREEILAICSSHGARNVRVFGSVARGEDGPGSDVDLLVEMDPGRTIMDVVSVYQEAGDVLNRKVDVVTDPGVSPYLRKSILSEARPL
jgi:uncharacterized protein